MTSLPPERRREELELDGPTDQVYRDNVEANRDHPPFFLGKRSQVSSGEVAQHVAFILVDLRLGGSHVMRRPRLHFDEAKTVAIPSDQVEIAAHFSTGPAPRSRPGRMGWRLDRKSTR